MLADVANSNLLRVFAYFAVAAVCTIAWSRERAIDGPGRPDVWPRLWLLTAILLLGFGVSRLVGAADLLTDIGREEARRGGYYEARRGFQALLVGGISLAWAASTLLAVWRVPERRRRYLPAVFVVLAIVFFAAIRLVSLHHLDQVLYNRPILGVRPVAFAEIGLLALLAAIAFLTLAGRTAAWLRGPSMRAPATGRPASKSGRP